LHQILRINVGYQFPECAIPFDVSVENIALIRQDVFVMDLLSEIGVFSLF